MIKIKDKEFVPFITESELLDRINVLGKQISEKFKDDQPILLGVLNGAFMFLSDLSKSIDIPVEVSFVKMSSYSGTSSTGEVKDLIGLGVDIKDRKVIVVEDIVDTGLSMSYLLELLSKKQPADVSVVTLLYKPEALKHAIKLDFVGFEIPNKFVVGYGLDYDGLGRNLPEIYQLK
ncbi:hypoxanthine phosphoribosyltransferase [Belliella kenyensis]|uniref:Hypoxanthine phosphoribosyltransferase n=1 Tax=Belliella kenyensis TaxID=1472724 RepID=A0ABV8EP78_9BACT|nr:hypoxanthine phosphoribosyltransferase [Belliella kenyensis]MCH7402804.1 hypoxanthine phosphoribosyltransferase [Belliella kenyensis]MDN3602510.1 hypoxanthine phosphoribosyltransferase [Belliella kenyensis]